MATAGPGQSRGCPVQSFPSTALGEKLKMSEELPPPSSERRVIVSVAERWPHSLQQPQRCHFDSVFSAVESLLSCPGGGGIGQSDRSALAFGDEHSSITATSVSSIPPRWRWWLEEQSPIKAVCNAFISRPNIGCSVVRLFPSTALGEKLKIREELPPPPQK